MKRQKGIFLLVFTASVLCQGIKSNEPVVKSIEEGVWKRKVGRPRKNAPIEYYRSSVSQVTKNNTLMVGTKSKGLALFNNGLLNNSRSVVNSLPKKWLTLRSLSRKGLIGAFLGFVGENAMRIIADFKQKERKKDTLSPIIEKTIELPSSANDKAVDNQLPNKQLSIVSDNKLSAKLGASILHKNNTYANDIAFIVLGGVGLTCIVGLGYGLYKAYQKIKINYFKSLS